MIWFTSDNHFNHANILKFCNRPFGSVEEMNEAMIKNWNELVSADDTIYHLGDFAMGSPRYVENILRRLNGRKILIIGNHDKQIMKCAKYFKEITPLKELKIGKISITLCHYAMRVWPKSHHNTWHLYGHSHGRLAPEGKSWDVGVDNNDFKPISLDEVEKIMTKRPDNFNLVRKK